MAPSVAFASPSRFAPRKRGGFTLIELLLVVAVIGIMTSLVVAAVTNSSEDARRVIARQQQAVVQEALNAWIANQPSIASASNSYTTNVGAQAKINLIGDYLDKNARWLETNSVKYNGNIMQSEVMQKNNASLSFTAWGASYPTVTLEE